MKLSNLHVIADMLVNVRRLVMAKCKFVRKPRNASKNALNARRKQLDQWVRVCLAPEVNTSENVKYARLRLIEYSQGR